MYLPTQFEETRLDVLHGLMRSHPLGLLITSAAHGMDANAIPFVLDADRGAHGTLRAHVARGNPVWRDARTDLDSLIVFQGPQAYVTPSWYATKAEGGRVVPTWNYVMVQARGRLRVVDDAAFVHKHVRDLTLRHESPRKEPWKVEDAPAEFTERLLQAIVGIEIEISALSGKWKVSQNRPAADRAGVAEGLREDARPEDDGLAMAQLVAPPAAGV